MLSNPHMLQGWRERWNGRLLQFIGRRVQARVDIEDLAQETYLRLLRAPDLEGVRNPQAYLLRVASHVMSEWRARQPPASAFEAVDEQSLVEVALPDLILEAEQWQAALDAVLRELSPMTRAVLLLRFREQIGCPGIAKALGLTERQVRRHLTRGYERLRTTLKE